MVIQNIKIKRFDRFGVVKECCDNRRYLIRLPSGKFLERNRRFLRPLRKPVDTSKNVVVGTSMHVVDVCTSMHVSKIVESTEPVVFNYNDCVLELEPPENVRMSHNNNFDDQCLRRAPIESEGIVTVPNICVEVTEYADLLTGLICNRKGDVVLLLCDVIDKTSSMLQYAT